MKTIGILSTFLLTAVVAAPAIAQQQVNPPGEGMREFTLGGSGAVDTDFNDSAGGITFSYGRYTTNALLWSIRQTANYSNPEVGGTAWNGATRIAADYHFGDARFRPLLGANVGYVYGDNVNDSFAAGLEGGAKYYVNNRSFVYALVEYAWLFEDALDVEDTFDDGRFSWTVGVGFNF